jgi:hypothetical protein
MIIHKLNNQKGQAFFEMIIFLPFLIFLYTIFYTVGNSISGSINQQKAVRGYYYQTVKGNSYISSAQTLGQLRGSIKTVGFYALGWAEKLENNTNPVAPCFAFSSFLKNGSSENCEDNSRPSSDTSSFIRIFTMYGVCGTVFSPPKQNMAVVVQGQQYIVDRTSQLGLCQLASD